MERLLALQARAARVEVEDPPRLRDTPEGRERIAREVARLRRWARKRGIPWRPGMQ